MKTITSFKKWQWLVVCMTLLLCVTPAFAEDYFVETTDIPSTINDYNESIKMTDEQALTYFERFLASKYNINSANGQVTPEVLNAFVQYAVAEGIIEDTAEQRTGITKAVVRAEFAAVVAGGELLGYTTAAAFLDHSLQDTPENLSFATGSAYAHQVLCSNEIQNAICAFVDYANSNALSAWTKQSSVALNSTTDLHLAYNRVNYIIAGTKSNGVWTLVIKVGDTYDFEKQDWENSMTDYNAVTALNNYAAYAQEIGAIVPYKISLTMRVFAE